MRAPRRIAIAIAVVGALAALAPVVTTTASAATSYEPQVINGDAAPAGRYPFMVALLDAAEPDNGDAFFCGGSLISATWVLTAAHCVADVDAGDLDVLVHSVDIEDGDRIHAADVIVHDGFDDDQLDDDVALVELAQPVTGITPLALAEPGSALERAGTDLTLTGWGATDPEGNDVARFLQEVELPVVPDGVCEDTAEADADGILCAGAPEDDDDGGTDSCYGDSGGPLFGVEHGERVQVGIVSFGVDELCGVELSAYTRVSAYRDWIDAHADLDQGPPTITRISGANRYATAAQLTTDRWEGPQDEAFVVTGESFPDALAAAAAAGHVGAPVLLTAATTLPAETAAALRAIHPDHITVVGGPGAVSDAVLAELDTLATAGATRLAGASRYDTAAALSRQSFVRAAAVFVASGTSFADALGGAGAAAHEDAPLLLTSRDSLPDATRVELARIGPDVVYVLGGAASVPDAVALAIEGLGTRVVRLAGADRYATSVAVLRDRFDAAGEVVIASGTDFPDGLVAGALGRPVVLVGPTGIAASTLGALTDVRVHRVTILGGVGAVAGAVETALRALA